MAPKVFDIEDEIYAEREDIVTVHDVDLAPVRMQAVISQDAYQPTVPPPAPNWVSTTTWCTPSGLVCRTMSYRR